MVAMESGGPSPLPSLHASRTPTPLNGSSKLNPNHVVSNGHVAAKRTKICVYCGSAPGYNPAHMEAARELARVMAERDIDLVYGGGNVGLMGEVAKTLVSLKGPQSVHGIIPEALVKYERDPEYTSAVAHGVSKESNLAVPDEKIYGRTTVVRDMHTRKQMMAQEVVSGGPGSGFLALSGGYGTIEELLETCTWNQLGIHNRGICVLNVDGFYDGILEWIQKSAREGFIKGTSDILVNATTAEEAIRALREYKVSSNVLKLSWGNE